MLATAVLELPSGLPQAPPIHCGGRASGGFMQRARVRDAAMLTAENNQRITLTGLRTRCGALMPRYRQPAVLAEELDTPRPVKRVRLLGEDLVLFRDDAGRYGLLDRHNAYRGAYPAFARCEDGGLRCPFHGWLYDASGTCLEQPAEPAGSTVHLKVRQPSYPRVERGGIVRAYLGPGEPPPMPAFDCFVAPD